MPFSPVAFLLLLYPFFLSLLITGYWCQFSSNFGFSLPRFSGEA